MGPFLARLPGGLEFGVPEESSGAVRARRSPANGRAAAGSPGAGRVGVACSNPPLRSGRRRPAKNWRKDLERLVALVEERRRLEERPALEDANLEPPLLEVLPQMLCSCRRVRLVAGRPADRLSTGFPGDRLNGLGEIPRAEDDGAPGRRRRSCRATGQNGAATTARRLLSRPGLLVGGTRTNSGPDPVSLRSRPREGPDGPRSAGRSGTRRKSPP